MMVAALAFLAPSSAESSACPELQGEMIRWVVTTRPGGGYDRYSRLIQPFLEKSLGTRIIIENHADAGGLVGALALSHAAPDGKTIGLVNASGLLTASTLLESRAPDILEDYSILARVVGNRMVLLTGQDSGIRSMGDLEQISASRPLVAGVRDVGSASFFALPVTATLLDLNHTIVAGYIGSTSRVLAAIRGDVDIIIQNFDSVRRFVESGELRPLMQISLPDSSESDQGIHIPHLGGRDGLAAQKAAARGVPSEEAIAQARSLAAVMSAGRVIVAPAGLPAATEMCLRTGLMGVLQAQAFQDAADKAGLSTDPVDAITVRSELLVAVESLKEFGQLVRSAIEQARL
jgi:tripartite-type tricarboxylate transporter receptor subunit TctC